MDAHGEPGPWWKRLAWTVAIWAVSVALIGTVAFLLRWWIR